MVLIVVLMTCHNRRDSTLACLAALHGNLLPPGTSLAVVLVDDGSTDGTGDSVAGCYPDVQVVRGDGSLFWNGGMRLAWDTAQARSHDYLLWLNDDTLLDGDAVQRLLAAETSLRRRLGSPAIVVGSTHFPGSEAPSYGGAMRRNWLRPMHFDLMRPGTEAAMCDTMNGNCVLVPREISLALGNLDPHFVHAMGDIDYGLRAKAAGYSAWVMPGYAGTCVNNHPAAPGYTDTSLPLAVRMRELRSPKALPPRSWLALTRRHAGMLWPLHWAWPYFRVITSSTRYAILKPVAWRRGRE